MSNAFVTSTSDYPLWTPTAADRWSGRSDYSSALIARTQRADAGVWSRITIRVTIGYLLSSS